MGHHGLDGQFRHALEGLCHGRQWRASQSSQRQIVETCHGNIAWHAPAPLAQGLDGSHGHVVVRSHHAVEGDARGKKIVHRAAALLGHEIAASHQRRIEGDAVSGENVLVGLESHFRFGVLGRSSEKHRPADPVIAHQVLDHGLHAASVVEHQTGNTRQRQADAAQAGRPVALEQAGDRIWPTEGREHA